MKLLFVSTAFLLQFSTASIAASCGSGEFAAKQFYDFAVQLEQRCAKDWVMTKQCGWLLERSTCALNKGLVQISRAGTQGASCQKAIQEHSAGLAIINENEDYLADLQVEGLSRLDATNKASFNAICGS